MAHPADALAVTGTALFGALGEPDRAVTVVCLIPAPPQARDHLLDVIGRGGPWERATEPLGPDAVLHLFRLRTRPATRVCFTEPSQPSQPSQPSERVHPSFAGLAAALLRRFAPTLVCTLDPDPEHLAWNEAEGAVYADHPDHAAVAGGVLEAVRAERPPGLAVECFRAAASCGRAAPAAIVRYPGPRIGAVRGADGRLTAYAALGGAVTRWTERTPGGPEWVREHLDTPSLLPVLSVARSPQGWVHLLALRRTPPGPDGAGVEVMHAVQYQTGRPVGAWHSLGNPNGAATGKGRAAGVPCAVVDAEGCVHVYVRNFGRGVSARSQRPDGSWTPWRDLQGSGVQDGMAAALDAAGQPVLFAPSRDGVLHWRHDAPAGDLRRAGPPLPLRVPPGTGLTALATGPGRVTLYGCDERDGVTYALRADGTVTALGGAGAAGAAAAAGACALRTDIDSYDCTVLLRRTPEGAVGIGAYPTEQEQAGLWWEPLGAPGPREPAAAIDGFGRLTVLSLGADGRLRVARQDPAVPGLAFGGWVVA
ncbi:hypothetical protein OHS33_28445 [Streptomyces sp. NBC_00536]|uniref:hypothetical protein n=1 Tax=Streptomyces sp. NBC_00536 TaxID=2975769 RepID=UPI002E815472|nr:hypothetical protein [Streptomyces sp. NBC_00536]WUC81926.1 hypothetical protein OHS33_28445 [Streptomyces sp. NBC_00536]